MSKDTDSKNASDSNDSKKSHSNIWRWLIIGVIVAGVIAAFATDTLTLENLKAQQEQLGGWVEANPVLAAAAFFGVYVVVTALSIPGAVVMTLAAGLLFGLIEGTLLVSFASAIGASLAFLVARFVFGDALRSRFKERLKKIDEGMEKDGAFYLLSLRLVVVFPFFLVNLLAGLTKIPLRTFYWVSQLGMLPGTIAYVFAGTQIGKIEKASDVLSPGLLAAFGALAALPLIMRFILRRIQDKRGKP